MYSEIKPDPTKSAEEAEIEKMAAAMRCRIIEGSMNAATQPAVPQSSITEAASAALGKFGWTTVLDDVLLPFIQRGDHEFVAAEMVAQAVIPTIKSNIVSNEVIKCWKLVQDTIDETEAVLLDEINQVHCDGLYGEHKFTKGDVVFKLCDLKEFLNFVNVCGQMITGAHKTNTYCGFIRVDSENVIPFVWDNAKQLVPLFYFDGQSEFFEKKAKELSDLKKLSYLQFCCKLQKIKPDYYEGNKLLVVDLEEIKKFFPNNTKFEPYYPDDINDELLPSKLKNTANTAQQTTTSSTKTTFVLANTTSNTSALKYTPPVVSRRTVRYNPLSTLTKPSMSSSNPIISSINARPIDRSTTNSLPNFNSSFSAQPYPIQTAAFPRTSPQAPTSSVPPDDRVGQSRAPPSSTQRLQNQNLAYTQQISYQPYQGPPIYQTNNYVSHPNNVDFNTSSTNVDSYRNYVVQTCLIDNRALSFLKHSSYCWCYIPIEEIDNFFTEFPRDLVYNAMNKLRLRYLKAGMDLREIWQNKTKRTLLGYCVIFQNARELGMILDDLKKVIIS